MTRPYAHPSIDHALAAQKTAMAAFAPQASSSPITFHFPTTPTSPGSNPFAFPIYPTIPGLGTAPVTQPLPGSGGGMDYAPMSPGPGHGAPGAGGGMMDTGSPSQGNDFGPTSNLTGRQAASLLGQVTGVPGLSNLLGPSLTNYGNTHGQNPFDQNPSPGVTVTDLNNPHPITYNYVGGSQGDPLGGGYGPNYFGSSRGTNEANYGNNALNDFTNSASNFHNTMNPGQGIGGGGAGGLGMDPYQGSASPWDWGNTRLY